RLGPRLRARPVLPSLWIRLGRRPLSIRNRVLRRPSTGHDTPQFVRHSLLARPRRRRRRPRPRFPYPANPALARVLEPPALITIAASTRRGANATAARPPAPRRR